MIENTRANRAIVGVAIAVAIVGAVLSTREAAAAYLEAYLAGVSVVLGVLAMIMIAQLTAATWFNVMKPHALVILRALPALGALGIVYLLTIPVLYHWTAARVPDGVGVYLSVPFFIVRFVMYWIAWIVLARAVRANSKRISTVGLIVLGLTMTFAAFDWKMSLTPDWSSTIYGVYWFAGAMVGGLSLLAVVARRDDQVTADHFHALAKLLLTFILFWLYIAFAQYIVIWSAGLPREVTWYALRTHGGWGGLAALLLFGNFVFPFLLLVVRTVKRNRELIAGLSITLLALHYLDGFWLIVPGLIAVTWWTVLLAIAMVIVAAGTVLLAARFLLGPPTPHTQSK